MTSYLIENGVKNLQNSDVYITRIPDFKKCNISGTI